MMEMIRLRQARSADAGAIRRLIWKVGINPMSLDWKRFVLAVDDADQLAGCGQIKPHGDGTRELASIAVEENYRGRGIARQIIEQLMSESSPPLYLTCRSTLEPFYQKFGFRPLSQTEMSPYFRRLVKFARLFMRFSPNQPGLSVMIWEM